MQSIQQLPVRQQRSMAIAVAIIVNFVILMIARVVNGGYPVATVSGDDQTIGIVSTIVVTAIVGLLAWGLLELLERRSGRAAATWPVIAVIVFLVSLLGPISSAVDTSSKLALIYLHIGAAATIIPLMGRTASRRLQA